MGKESGGDNHHHHSTLGFQSHTNVTAPAAMPKSMLGHNLTLHGLQSGQPLSYVIFNVHLVVEDGKAPFSPHQREVRIPKKDCALLCQFLGCHEGRLRADLLLLVLGGISMSPQSLNLDGGFGHEVGLDS